MKKKRILLLIICFTALCLSAAPASAGMYTLDVPTALQFTNGSVSASDTGALTLVTQDPVAYGALTMQGAVGFVGWLDESPADAGLLATMTIGAGDNAGLSTSYTGYQAYIANDNDDPWDVRLFVTTADGTTYSDGGFVTLTGDSDTILTLTSSINFSSVINFGFEVRGDFSKGSPSDPDFFHMSVVPVPAAVMLGMLGLGVAGWKLRRFA